MRATLRRPLAILAGLAATFALSTAVSPTADAATGTVSTGGVTLTLRSGASSTTTALANIPHGTALNLICKMPGQSITGTQGTTAWWDRVSYGGKTGYVSAAYVSGGLNTSVCGVTNTSGTTLTLRSSASTSGTALANIPHGTLLPLACKKSGSSVTGVYGTTSLWDKVTYGGQTGYISAAYVSNGTNAAVPACPTPAVYGVVNTPGATLTLRAGTSSATSALASIPHGTTLTLQCKIAGQSVTGNYGTTSTWNKVTYGGKTGYVSAAYVSNGNSASLPGCPAPAAGWASPAPSWAPVSAWFPYYPSGGAHTGIDIAYRGNFFSACTGTIDRIYINPYYPNSNTYYKTSNTASNMLWVNCGSGIRMGYAHWYASELPSTLKVGTVVKAGQVLAPVGNQGYSTGYHLHFQVQQNGVNIHGFNFLKSKGVTGLPS